MNIDIEDSDQIMSTRDAALCLGVSVRTVQLWVESGSLEAWKTPGGHRRIYRQSVNSMLAARNARQITGAHFEILVCEDLNDASGQVEAQLKSLGSAVRVRTVHNSDEALIKIAECCSNLLVIDLVMVNSTGIQMLDALRNSVFMHTMHIIVVTDLDVDAMQKLGGLHPGVTKFTKPVPYAQMLRLIRIYMDISKTQ